MDTPRAYEIGTGERDGHLKEYFIATLFDGLDSTSPSCEKQLYLTLDMEVTTSTGRRWETLSTEGEEYWPETETDAAGNMVEMPRRGIWLDTQDDFSWIVASITQKDFVGHVQPKFETDKSYVAT
jgi:hypothetical protein